MGLSIKIIATTFPGILAIFWGLALLQVAGCEELPEWIWTILLIVIVVWAAGILASYGRK